MFELLSWYGLSWLVGLLALPLCFVIFKRLPERGYTLSKPLGLLLAALLSWWISNASPIPFVQLSFWLEVGAIALVMNLVLLRLPRLRHEIFSWFRHKANLKLVLTGEALFLGAYLFMLNSRSFSPELNRDEKFFDLAFIQALATSPSLPVQDPWFGGQKMHYYYGGQLLVAWLCKLSGIPATTGYNLAMGLVYALTVIACFGFATNLAKLAGARGRTVLTTGVLGALFEAVLGNLYGLRQLVRGELLAPGNPDFPLKLAWWDSARMIWDYLPDHHWSQVLSEAPVYSYLMGDLHAHLLALPFAVGVLSLGLESWCASEPWVLARPTWGTLPRFVAYGGIVGALAFINGFDFPTYSLLLVLLIGLRELQLQAISRWWASLGRSLLQLVSLGVGAGVVYLFYFLELVSQHGSSVPPAPPPAGYVDLPGPLGRLLGWVSWTHTYLSEYLIMFGLFLLPILTFYAFRLRELWWLEQQVVSKSRKPLPSSWQVGVKLVGVVLFGLGLVSLGFALADFSVGSLTFKSVIVALVTLPSAPGLLWPKGWLELRQRPRLVIEAMVLLILLELGPLWQFELLGVAVAMLYLSVRLLLHSLSVRRRHPADPKEAVQKSASWLALIDSFVLLALTVASGLILFCELFYIRDYYNARGFTLWKLWYQVWLLYGFGAAYFVWRLSWQALNLKWSDKLALADPHLKALPQRAGWSLVKGLKQKGSQTGYLSLFWLPIWFRRWLPAISLPGLGTGKASLVEEQPFGRRPVSFSGRQPEGVSPEVRPQVQGLNWKWRLWLGMLVSLMVLGAATPGLGYWQHDNYYSNRVGLDGEEWYAREYPAEYPAMRWLRDYTRDNPTRRGIVLEANGLNYTWANRVSTYTGLPTIVGWPFHELHWRGYLDPLEIWESWLDMERIYQTTDPNQALALLKKHQVRYVFVGQVENGSRSFFPDGQNPKKYPAEGLAKFSSFMRRIYYDPTNNIAIYAFE
jgi:YYY domain-containing protein